MNQKTKELYRYKGETSLITALALLRAGNTEDALEYAITAIGNIGAAANSGSIERVVGRLATSIKKVQDNDTELQAPHDLRKHSPRQTNRRAAQRGSPAGQDGGEPAV